MAKRTILIADDNRTIHQLYADYLGDEFEYLHAYDGAEALMLAVEHLPDVLLLDLMMPLLDGRSICSKLKGNPRTREIAVIMVTARGDHSDRIVGFELGADDYLEKPCPLDLLSRSIRRHLR